MSNLTIVPTYNLTHDPVIDGYFIVGDQTPLSWVAVDALIPIYGNDGLYTEDYKRALSNRGKYE